MVPVSPLQWIPSADDLRVGNAALVLGNVDLPSANAGFFLCDAVELQIGRRVDWRRPGESAFAIDGSEAQLLLWKCCLNELYALSDYTNKSDRYEFETSINVALR